MKRLFSLLFPLVAFMPFVALAQTGESIPSFDVRATLEADRGFIVTEEIEYDFGENERHGIFRDIPERYERSGATYRLRLDVKRVHMDGEDVPYRVSRKGDDLRIRIGDPDAYVTGRHVYTITYHTDRAINFFDGEGELYWNVTGNRWEVPIGSTAFQLTAPQGFNTTSARLNCFTGPFGSTASDCRIVPSGAQATIATLGSLAPGEGLTIVARFPPGLIAEPTLSDRVWGFIYDNGVIALPFLTLAVMLWIWNTKGRDPQGRGTVVPQYEPPRGMSPGEMAALRGQAVPQNAITATILDLARRGYLKIEFGDEKGFLKTSQTYTFIKGKGPDADLSTAETEVLEGLFEKGDRTELADLQGAFYKRITPFKNAIFSSLKTRGLFEQSPYAVRAAYMVAAAAVGVGAIWIFSQFITPLAIGMIAVSALIVAVVGWFMPRVTKEGAVALEEVEGFKWFLSVTEKDRLKFHNAPKVKPSMFHLFLPAAIAFGVEEQWADQFKGLNVPPPDYASGSVVHHWAAMNFVHSIGRMEKAAAASAFVAPSSAGAGGSGFSGGGSGGGFGGGGGGSW